jgi:hypothetical protein
VSDLFKKNRPRLGEDEERALWERVRTIPREAGGRRAPAPGADRALPWWAGLWARPAVRFGAPALAVALVAVVWVTQREPVTPARQPARVVEPPSATAPAAPSDASEPLLPEQETAPAPAVESRARVAAGARSEADERAPAVAEEQRDPSAAGARDDAMLYAVPPPAAAPTPTRVEAEVKEGTRAGAVSGVTGNDATAKKSRQTAQAQPQAVEGFYRDDPRTGTIRAVGEASSSGPARVAELRAARGSRTSAALIGDRILVEVVAPSGSGTFLETVSLPLSGGTARIAVGNTPGSLWVEDGQVRDLIRIAGHEGVADAPTRRRVDLATGARGAGAAAIVVPDRRALSSRFVPADGGSAQVLGGPRSTSRSRAAALAAELILAVAEGDASAVARVHEAAHRMAAERPDDASARALAAWSNDAQAAFGD